MRVESLECRVKIRCVRASGHIFYYRAEKPSPFGGRWRGTRRMRGICPAVAPSSVTCGDSFPRRGKPFGRFTRNVHVAVLSRAGHTPPLPRNDLYCPVGRGDPTPPGKLRLPQISPSSVTCGDSFPRRGKPIGGGICQRVQKNRHQKRWRFNYLFLVVFRLLL